MPVTYPLSLPTSPTSQVITLRKHSVGAKGISPFSLVSQVQMGGGQCWSGSVVLPRMTRAQAEPWIAKLVSLNGVEGSFLAGDSANKLPRGVATGTPLVKGGGQTGYDLITDGWTSGVTGILKAGDWVQLGSGSSAKLYKNIVDVNSNGSGEATLTLWPRITSAPADNAALVISSPMGKFMLAQDVEWNIDPGKIYSTGFEIIQDLRP